MLLLISTPGYILPFLLLMFMFLSLQVLIIFHGDHTFFFTRFMSLPQIPSNFVFLAFPGDKQFFLHLLLLPLLPYSLSFLPRLLFSLFRGVTLLFFYHPMGLCLYSPLLPSFPLGLMVTGTNSLPTHRPAQVTNELFSGTGGKVSISTLRPWLPL